MYGASRQWPGIGGSPGRDGTTAFCSYWSVGLAGHAAGVEVEVLVVVGMARPAAPTSTTSSVSWGPIPRPSSTPSTTITSRWPGESVVTHAMSGFMASMVHQPTSVPERPISAFVGFLTGNILRCTIPSKKKGHKMTGPRTAWIIFCCIMATFWAVAGFFTFGLAWPLVLVSLFAIFIPVGKERQEDGKQRQEDGKGN